MTEQKKAEELRDELRALAEAKGAKAIVIVVEGNVSAYAYTNMGPGTAVDLISTARASLIEGLK